jgi:hypothetical protein
MYIIEQTEDGKTWEKVFENKNVALLLAQFVILVNNRDFLKATKFRVIETILGWRKEIKFN